MNRLIRTVRTNPGLVIANNLISGPGISLESDSEITFVDNLQRDMTSVLVDPARGDLHLTKPVGGATRLPDVTSDIDRESRDAAPDVGADEWMDTEKPV